MKLNFGQSKDFMVKVKKTDFSLDENTVGFIYYHDYHLCK